MEYKLYDNADEKSAIYLKENTAREFAIDDVHNEPHKRRHATYYM